MKTYFVPRPFFSTRAGLSLVALLAMGASSKVVAELLLLRETSLLTPLAADAVRPAERAFLDKATEIGRLQQRLAEMGASQATSADVRGHAEQLKSDNRQLVDAITSLAQKKGAAVRPLAEPSSDAYAQLAGKSGADFDREFVRVMAELHETTITLFEQTAAEAKDVDVRDLAAAQLPMLRAHRNRITELKKTVD